MVSKYPRPGYPIIPDLLRTLYRHRVPSHLLPPGHRDVKFCDLGGDSWLKLGDEHCRAIGGEALRQFPALIPYHLRTLSMPRVPVGLSFDDLDLAPRTLNCLRHSRQKFLPTNLHEFTIYDVCQMHGFGVRSLFDLLNAIEAVAPRRRETIHIDDEDIDALSILSSVRATIDPALLSRNDPRFGGFIRRLVPGASNLEDALLFIEEHDSVVTRAQYGLMTSLIAAVGRSRSMTLNEELSDFLQLFGTRRHREIAARYFGWDGLGGATLQTVGDEFGITRERVRQLLQPLRTKLADQRPFAPRLDAALALAEELVPCGLDQMADHFVLAGMCRPRMRLDSLLETAEMLGRSTSMVMVGTEEDKVILEHPGRIEIGSDIVAVARRLVRHWGATTFSAVSADMPDLDEPEEMVERILARTSDFVLLDSDGGWFTFPSVPRNRLTNRITKILSVAPTISCGELRRGIARSYRMDGFAPPRRVIAAMCRAIPGVTVESDRITSLHAPRPELVLGGFEMAMYRMIMANGGLMQRRRIEALSAEQGMSRSTAEMLMSRSPILLRYGHGVIGVIGTDVEPGVVESLETKRKSKTLEDYGWANDGTVWLSYKLSQNMLSTGVFHVPAAVKPYVHGRHELRTESGQQFGTIAIEDTGCWGVGRLFRQNGVEEGDTLLLKIDPRTHKALAFLGQDLDADEIEPKVSIQ